MSWRIQRPVAILAVTLSVCLGTTVQSPQVLHAQELVKVDPLPSWSAGDAKTAILDFVAQTTGEGSPELIPIAERVAVFDNDGTLWPENPLPFELAFTFDMAKARIGKKPQLKDEPAYKALVAGDIATLTEDNLKLLRQLIADTHTGMTTEEFEQAVTEWIATAKHPRFKRLYQDCTYLPMQEVLAVGPK